MSSKRVVVTGMGALTPLGNSLESTWENLVNGTSGAQPITLFDVQHFKTRFACELKGLDFEDHFDRKAEKKLDRCGKIGMVAAREGIKNSGLDDYTDLDKERVGVVWGSGIGGLDTFESELELFYTRFNKKPKFNPFFIPKMIVDIVAGIISIEKGYTGPNYSTVSACATSTNAIIDGYMLIKMNKADVMIVGGSEAPITNSGIGGFNALHALSTRNDDPKSASRPFDKNRNGFVMGEGGGCMVLEDYDHAVKRGANIMVEVSGTGLTADAYHMTAPHPEGIGATRVMRQCIEEAGLTINDVDHVNMHGTSTPLGDIAESVAIYNLFKDAEKQPLLNSTKSMTGHLLGAAGIVEAIASAKSILTSIIPPTINNFDFDEKLPSKLEYVLNKAVEREVNVAISNTFGFGGHNASVLFKKV